MHRRASLSPLDPQFSSGRSNAARRGSNGLLLACVALGVPFALLSAWLILWAAKPIAVTLEAIGRDNLSRSTA